MTSRVAWYGIRHTEHHWAGRINDWVAGAEVRPIALAAERHWVSVAWAALDRGLHPYYTACGSISFQCRNCRRVLSEEISDERVIPVKNHYAIITEINRRQVVRRKNSISVPVSRDSILKNSRAPRIMRLKHSK